MTVLTTDQIQCLMQILANRLCLIMYDPVKQRRLKLGLLIVIGIINVSVFIIWVPARRRVSPTWIHVNNIWDRIEKAIFAAIDLALNTYFMWLVRTKLVACGLTQYNLLYKYNIVMVSVSMTLDVSSSRCQISTKGLPTRVIKVLLIGLMSLPDDAV